MVLLSIFTALIGLCLAFYNAFIFAMTSNRVVRYNKLVHKVGYIARLIWTGVVLFWGISLDLTVNQIIVHELYAIVMFWPVFNLVYNYVNRENPLHIGSKGSATKSWFDRTFHKFILPAQGLLILTTILWNPLNLFDFFTKTLMESFRERWIEWIVVVAIVVITVLVVKKFRKRHNIEGKNKINR